MLYTDVSDMPKEPYLGCVLYIIIYKNLESYLKEIFKRNNYGLSLLLIASNKVQVKEFINKYKYLLTSCSTNCD